MSVRARILVGVVGAVVAAAGCSKAAPGADDCARFVEKSRPVMSDMMKTAGRTLSDADVAKMLDTCKKGGPGGQTKDPVFACVVGAADDAAVRACYAKGLGSYAARSKAVEAKVALEGIGRGLDTAYQDTQKIPVGTAGPTPATPCCQGPDQKCPLADWAADPVWSALLFGLPEPTRFQYAYQSDGTTARATATGDLDCDGTTITFTLTATIEGGAVKVNIAEPTTED